MKNKVYTVTAYKRGSRKDHSYIVGVYSKKHAAIKAAEIEEEWRGKKEYECEVLEWELDKGCEGNTSEAFYKNIRSAITTGEYF